MTLKRIRATIAHTDQWTHAGTPLIRSTSVSLSRRIGSGTSIFLAARRVGTVAYVSDRNSYSSITAAIGTLASARLASTRTTFPLQRTRMLSVSVISGGRVRVKSISEPTT